MMKTKMLLSLITGIAIGFAGTSLFTRSQTIKALATIEEVRNEELARSRTEGYHAALRDTDNQELLQQLSNARTEGYHAAMRDAEACAAARQ